nr:reverse transcriptase domain-containing protein [Tanacetum cinerariifolium]
MGSYKDLLRACPHYGFTELHQLDTFYNALNPADQDSLNSAAGGNLLERRTQDTLMIIKNKSKCLAADGNTFLELRDNIQGYISAATVNHNQEIEYFLNNDPINEIDSILEDLVDEDNLADLNDNLADTMPEMFTDEDALDYSSSLLYDEYDDDLFKVEPDTKYVYDDPFDSNEEKIKESKLLIDELDLPRSSDFLPSPEYDSFLFEDFSKVDALPSTDNEDKVFNPAILIQENLSEFNTRIAPDKNVKKIAISHASLILEDFDPSLYELPFLKEVLGSETLLSFLFKNKEKVFKHGILTSKGVHFSLLLEYLIGAIKFSKSLKFSKARWRFFLAFVKRTSASWMFFISTSIPHERMNSGG